MINLPWRNFLNAEFLYKVSKGSTLNFGDTRNFLVAHIDGRKLPCSIIPVILIKYRLVTDGRTDTRPGPDVREGANWAVAQGPPQLMGLYKNSKKIIT